MFNLGNNNAPLNKDQMHPDDTRNLVIFLVIAAILYFSYDAFILQPQSAAIKARVKAQAQVTAVDGPSQNAAKLVKAMPRAQVISEARGRIAFENDELKGTINPKGATLDDLQLKEYYETLEKEEYVSLLTPKGAKGARSFEYGWVADDSATSVPTSSTLWGVRGNDKLTPETPVELVWNNGQGIIFIQRYELDEQYAFTITQSVENNSGEAVTLYPYGLVAQRGLPENFQPVWISHEGPVGYIGKELEQPQYKDLRKEKEFEYTADQGWLGLTEKYWLTALIPPQGQNVKYKYNYSGDEKDQRNIGLYQADYIGGAVDVPAGQSKSVTSHAYAGAKKVLALNDYEEKLGVPHFSLAVDFGWFWFLTYPFFYALHYIGLAVGNMGIAVILLTIVIRGMVFPLTNISYRSFAKMKKVAPQTKVLREKYGEDKQKLQQELIKMYSQEGVNPMAGCLPMVLQIPIFFALYKVFFNTIELRHAPFFGWIQDLSAPDPTSIFNLFGLIPFDVPGFLHIGVWPCLMLLGMVIQKNMNPPPQDKLQRDMAMYMPFIFAFIMSRFASGLVVYWTFSAYIGILQQIIIMRSMGVPIYLFGEKEEEEMTKGVDVHPLAAMAEEEVEDALFGEHEEEQPAKPISKPKPKKKTAAKKGSSKKGKKK
ncbi:MAG: membrane protein insertase YidC [Micavibrio sp.]|nr:membrane protein insertase YidC [Micavibrio sp.]